MAEKEKLGVWLRADKVQALRAQAADERRTLSAVVEAAVDEYLARHAKATA